MGAKKFSITLLTASLAFVRAALCGEVPAVPLHEDPILPAAKEVVVSDRTAIMKLKPQKIVADVTARRTVADAAGTYIGTLGINPALLTKPGEPVVNVGGAVLGIGLPPDMARVQLDLAGEQYDLSFFDEKRDQKYGLRHVTMNVVNQEGAFARFSIDDRNGLVYGTLYTAARAIQILPGKQPGQQEAYLSSVDRIRSQPTGLSSNPRIDVMAWRHRQLEEVARLLPQYADATYESRSAFLQGGKLGRMSRLDAKEFTIAATRLASVTQFTGSESFRIIDTMPTTGGGQRIRFQQLIGGIPVETYSEIVVDGTLQILRLATVLAPNGFVADRALLSKSDAWKQAVVEWQAREVKTLDAMSPLPEGTLVYKPNVSINDLELTYRFRFADKFGFEYIAYVNAVTGGAEIVHLFHHNFPFRTCQELDFGQPIATGCPAPGSNDIVPIRLYAVPAVQNYNCGPPLPQPPPLVSFCETTSNLPILEVLNDLRTVLPAATSTNPPGLPTCCAQLGTVQVVNGSRMPDGTTSIASGSIFISGLDGASREIVAHEFAHVYTLKYNEVLGATNIVFAQSIVEGLADSFAGIYGTVSNNPSQFGSDPWTHGDGAGYVGTPRSGRNPSFQFWQDIKAGVDPHDGGQVIFRFFRRLQERTGVGFQRLLGIALATASTVRDLDGNGIDAGDFRQAVLGALAQNETALKSAVQATYAELYNATAGGPLGPPLPAGEPGPVGSPFAPASYAGSFLNCSTFQGAPVTVYQTWWTASPGATAYGLFVKGADEAAYRYSDTAPGGQTNAFIFTNIPGDGRINACNADGCSGLTLDRVVVTQLPQCGGQ